MTDLSKILVKLEPKQGKEDRRAPLDEYANVCGALRNCIKNVARCVGKDRAQFAISDLRIGSAIMEAEPETSEWTEVGVILNDTFSALEDGRGVDERLDYQALHCFSGFAAISKSEKLRLSFGNTTLTKEFAINLQLLIGETATTRGSVAGRLEALVIHNAYRFTIYPPIKTEKIECDFKLDDLQRVLAAVNRQVTVWGKLHHAKAKVFPVRVEVEDFTVEPENDSLPTLLESRGALKILRLNMNNPVSGSFADEWA
jgi:hypothetical protein